MKKIKDYCSFLISLGLDRREFWNIAIRNRTEKCLWEGNNAPFYLVDNDSGFWCADPFLFEYEGKHYLFVEQYDIQKQKGRIAYAEINNRRVSKFKVCLELRYHLSYPCVFEKNGEIYMTPECSQSGEVPLYRASAFPDKWEKFSVISKAVGSDTTPIPGERKEPEEWNFLSTVYTELHKENDNLFLISSDIEKPIPLMERNTTARSAGHIVCFNGRLIRPSQDDTNEYGRQVIFNEITSLKLKDYHEKRVYVASPPKYRYSDDSVAILLKGNSKHFDFSGLHTYNADSKYEVIDLKCNHYWKFTFFVKNLKRYAFMKLGFKKGKVQ